MTLTNRLFAYAAARRLAGLLFIVFLLGSCVGKPAGGQAAGQDSLILKPAVDYDSLVKLLEGNPGRVLLLDVRTAEEFAQGHISGAVLSPYDQLESSFAEPDKSRPIVVYCRSGRRSAIALATLRGMGYLNVSDFGGIGNWKGTLEP